MSVAVIATYLAFFPVAVNALRGLSRRSAAAGADALVRGDGRRDAGQAPVPGVGALPHPRAQAGGAPRRSSGAIVGEISAGTPRRPRPADHRLLPAVPTDPAGLHARSSPPALLGILFVGLIDVLDRVLMRGRPGRRRDTLLSAAAIAVSGVDKVFNPGRKGEVDGADRHRPRRRATASSSRSSGRPAAASRRCCGWWATSRRRRAGSVEVNGKPARQARLDHDYGMAFQQAGLFDWRTVAANVELPLELLGWDSGRRRERVAGAAGAGRTSTTSRGTARGSCPAACSSGSRSPGHWPCDPASC